MSNLPPINPPPKINTFGRMISREIVAQVDQEIRVFDVDLDDDIAWTIVWQEQDVGVGSATVLYRRNLVELKQEISFGRNGGELITGVGSFSFSITGGMINGCRVRAFWTLQPRLIDVASLTDATQSLATATTVDLGSFGGFIPYPYNAVSIFTTAVNFLVAVIDTGSLPMQSLITITPPDPFVMAWQIPPNGRVRIRHNTGAAETFTPLYTRIS